MATQMTHDDAVKICKTLNPIAGTPPEIGWWMTSYFGQVPKMRWWGGECWSVYCTQEEAEAGICDRYLNVRSMHPNNEIAYYPRVWEGKFLARKKG